MSQINVNRIKDSNEGAPDFPSGVNVSGVTSTVTLGVTNLNATNLNVLGGVCTATTFDGSLPAAGTPTLGLGVTINASGLNISGVATAGIVSATTLYGDGQYITGIALSIAPLNYNPAVGGLAVGSGSGIGITFNQKAVAGSGNVTLSIANAGVAGTVVENFGVGNSVTYGKSSYGDTITITPTSSLDSSQTYHLSYPSGAFTNGGDVSYVGTAYTFITVGGQLWVWGHNENGQLGINNETEYSSPVQLPGKGWSNEFSSSYDNVGMGIKHNGELWMWGLNNYGPLGQNNQTSYSSPVQVPGTTWSNVTVGDNSPAGASVFGIKTDGTAWTWGNNLSGQLGQNNRTSVSSPIQIPGTTWKQASGCEKSIMVVKTDGTLWAMGGNAGAKLGLNTPVNSFYSSPTQVPGTTWNAIEHRGSCSMASKTDGTIWMWGSNSGGALGQNNRTQYSSPVQVPGTDWGLTVHTMGITSSRIGAIKTDGTLWTWGSNSFGCLGHNQGPGTYYSSPTQVPGTTWKSLTISPHTGLATKTDGTLWAWGINTTGQLGQNEVDIDHSSPVQIGSDTNWSFVARQCRNGGMMAHKEV